MSDNLINIHEGAKSGEFCAKSVENVEVPEGV